MLRTPSATKPQMGSLIITQLQTQMMLQEMILHPQLTFTAILSSEAGLALTPAEHALPVARPRAAARAALSELPLCRHADADGLRLAVVVVEGDEPMAVGQVQRQVLLHSLLQLSNSVQKPSGLWMREGAFSGIALGGRMTEYKKDSPLQS